MNDDNKIFYIRGYALVFDIDDRHGDLIVSNASIKIRNQLPILWNHDDVLTSKILSIEIDIIGLKIEALLSLSKSQQFLLNFFVGLSIGFISNKSFYDHQISRLRYIKDLTLHEISIVEKPSNDFAKLDIIFPLYCKNIK